MKKLLFVTENEKQRILEMHRITDKSTVISEQVKELEHLVSNSFVKGLEKNDVKAFDELSTIIGRKGSETLDVAFVRVLDSAIKGGNRADGVNALKFCKKLSLINDEFAEKFYQSQIKVIDKIRLHPEYSKQWELMVKANFGERVLEKYKKGLSSSSTNASSKIDELGIASQINSYLNPNRFDGLTKQAFDAQVVLTKNNLSSSSGIFTNQALLNDVFGIIFSKKATGTQIQEVLDIMSMKIAFNKEEKEVFDKLLNHFTTGKNPSFAKYETPWLNDLANMGSNVWNGAKPIVEPLAKNAIKKGVNIVKWGAISVGVLIFLIIALLFAALSSSGGSKKQREWNSKRSSN